MSCSCEWLCETTGERTSDTVGGGLAPFSASCFSMVGSVSVRTTEEVIHLTILRLVLALVGTVATVFPTALCRLTSRLLFLYHVEPATLPSQPLAFPRRLYGGRLARTYPHR